MDIAEQVSLCDYSCESECRLGISDGDAPMVGNVLCAAPLQPRRGHGKGDGILCAQNMIIPLP